MTAIIPAHLDERVAGAQAADDFAWTKAAELSSGTPETAGSHG